MPARLRGQAALPRGLFQFATSFSLPSYAIAVRRRASPSGCRSPDSGACGEGPTAGRWYVNVSSGVPPKHFVRGEWFVVTAFMTGIVWLIAYALGASTWLSAGIAFAFG